MVTSYHVKRLACVKVAAPIHQQSHSLLWFWQKLSWSQSCICKKGVDQLQFTSVKSSRSQCAPPGIQNAALWHKF